MWNNVVNSIIQKCPIFLAQQLHIKTKQNVGEKHSSFIDVVEAHFPEYQQTAPSCNTRTYSLRFLSPSRSISPSLENRSARNSTDNWRYCMWTSGAQTEYHSNTYSRSWYLPTCILQKRRIDSIDIHGPSRGTQMWGYSLELLPSLLARYTALTLCFLARDTRGSQAKQVTTSLKLSFWFVWEYLRVVTFHKLRIVDYRCLLFLFWALEAVRSSETSIARSCILLPYMFSTLYLLGYLKKIFWVH